MRPDLYIDAVLRKCDALKRSGLWAPEPKVRPRAWLANFQPDEKITAAVLLDHFVYYSAAAVDRLLHTGYQNLCDELVAKYGGHKARTLLREAIFTRVEGEDPNPTDSGNLFCRKARQILMIPEERVVEPIEALSLAADGRPVVFIDDFVGSGDQFLKTWSHEYYNKPPHSFCKLQAIRPFIPIYLSLLATNYGLSRISRDAQQVQVVATHTVATDYSVKNITRNPVTPMIPDLSEKIELLLSKYAPSLSVPRYMNALKWRTLGYHELGLLVTFDHSTPDASLPLLWADGPTGWTPLVRRT